VRFALVDVAAGDLDRVRAALARALPGGRRDARRAEPRLVIADSPEALAFRWARLSGAARAGVVSALGDVVVEAVVLGAPGPRTDAAARLAAALGAHVVRLESAAVPEAAGGGGRSGAPR
jgi:hypothetical protein